MFIFFCEHCSKFDAFKSKSGNFKCPDCGGEYLALGVTVDEWNSFSNDEMLSTIEKAKHPIEIKTPDFSQKPAASDKNISETDTNTVNNAKAKTSTFVKPSLPDNINSKGWLIAGAVVFILVAIIAFYSPISEAIEKKNTYNKLLEAEQSGDYTLASMLCNTIPDYKNVPEIQVRVQEKEAEETAKKEYDELLKQYKNLDTADITELMSMLDLADKCQQKYDVTKIQNDLYEHLAVAYYEANDAQNALEYFSKIDGTGYEDQIKKCNQVIPFLGTWKVDVDKDFETGGTVTKYVRISSEGVHICYHLVLDTGKISFAADKRMKGSLDYSYTFDDVSDNNIKISSSHQDHHFYIDKNLLHQEYTDVEYEIGTYNFEESYEKTEDLDKSDVAKGYPKIGMTADEVLATEWGKPEKINKSTYSWGTSEQWCYKNNKYVYFDNGVVTSIQD